MRAIADTGTMSAAAEILGTSQPAVSQQVRRLENKLGSTLVERAGRGVRLTEAGAILARHGIAVASAVRAASEEIEALAGLQTGKVRLTAFPSASSTIVPRALVKLRDEHPGIRVTLEEAEPPQSLPALRSGITDLVVAFDYPPNTVSGQDVQDLVTVHLLDDPMWLAVPSGHPLVEGLGPHQHRPHDIDPIDLSRAQNDTWIAGCPRCRGHLLDVCHASGFEPHVAYATDDYSAVISLVAVGLGVALVPALVLDSAAQRDVHLLPITPRSVRRVFAATTHDLEGVPAIAAVLNTLRTTTLMTAKASRFHLSVSTECGG